MRNHKHVTALTYIYIVKLWCYLIVSLL